MLCSAASADSLFTVIFMEIVHEQWLHLSKIPFSFAYWHLFEMFNWDFDMLSAAYCKKLSNENFIIQGKTNKGREKKTKGNKSVNKFQFLRKYLMWLQKQSRATLLVGFLSASFHITFCAEQQQQRHNSSSTWKRKIMKTFVKHAVMKAILLFFPWGFLSKQKFKQSRSTSDDRAEVCISC